MVRDYFNRGYEYGKEQLARDGVQAQYRLNNYLQNAHRFNSYDDYDRGILKALEEWKKPVKKGHFYYAE